VIKLRVPSPHFINDGQLVIYDDNRIDVVVIGEPTQVKVHKLLKEKYANSNTLEHSGKSGSTEDVLP
jgi:hypothetical protein